MRTTTAVLIAVSITLLIAVAGGAFIVLRFVNAKTEATPVRIEKPSRGKLTEFVRATGTLKPVKHVSMRSRISAQIVELPVEEGRHVTKGDPEADPPVSPTLLFRLDDSDLRSQLSSSEARYEAQKAEVEVAQRQIETRRSSLEGVKVSIAQAARELRRQNALLETNDISQSVVDKTQSQLDELKTQLAAARNRLKSAEFSLKIAKQNLKAAEADVSRAKERLSYTVVNSPIDGVVTRVTAEAGEMATGSLYNPGTLIVEVADISQMIMKAEVDETDITDIEEGQHAKVRIQAWPDKVFQGVVDTCALSSSTSRTGSQFFAVEILLQNKDGKMLSGMTADADIEIHKHTDVLKIPSQAVLSREVDSIPLDIREDCPEVDTKKSYTTCVYRHKSGKAVVTPVKIGKSDATHTILLSGVSERDEIVAGP